MSKIMRQLEAEARAAREAEQRRKDAMDRCASDCPEPCAACLMDQSTAWVSASDIGADVPSAPNDPPLEHWWQYAHAIGRVPDAPKDVAEWKVGETYTLCGVPFVVVHIWTENDG